MANKKSVPPYDSFMTYKKGDKVLIAGTVFTIGEDTNEGFVTEDDIAKCVLKAELPLLNSERKELLQRIKDSENKADTIFGAVTRKHNSIIVRAKYLTTEQKEMLLAEIVAS